MIHCRMHTHYTCKSIGLLLCETPQWVIELQKWKAWRVPWRQEVHRAVVQNQAVGITMESHAELEREVWVLEGIERRLFHWVWQLVWWGWEKRGNPWIIIKEYKYLSWVSNHSKHNQVDFQAENIEYANASIGALPIWESSLKWLEQHVWPTRGRR